MPTRGPGSSISGIACLGGPPTTEGSPPLSGGEPQPLKCAVSYVNVAGSNPAACARVSGQSWNMQVGRFDSIKEGFLVSVELGGVLNWIQTLRRTSHTGYEA